MVLVHTITSLPHTESNFVPFQGQGIRLRDSRLVSQEYAKTTAQACPSTCAVGQSLWEERYERQSIQLETTVAALEVITATVKVLQLEIARVQQQVPLGFSAGPDPVAECLRKLSSDNGFANFDSRPHNIFPDHDPDLFY